MIQVTRIPLPASGFVRVRTAESPVSAHRSGVTLDQFAAALDDKRQAEVARVQRDAAYEEATANAAKALSMAVDRLDEARERAEEALSADAVSLGVEIARQILKIEIDASNYGLEKIVRATLAASEVKRGHCIVHVHPKDAVMLESVVFRDETVVSADGDIPRGTVQVETPRGLLVREPNAALEEIREQLLEDLV